MAIPRPPLFLAGAKAARLSLTETEIRHRYAAALGRTQPQADEFMADLWNFYCGELDDELVRYAGSLRPGTARDC